MRRDLAITEPITWPDTDAPLTAVRIRLAVFAEPWTAKPEQVSLTVDGRFMCQWIINPLDEFLWVPNPEQSLYYPPGTVIDVTGPTGMATLYFGEYPEDAWSPHDRLPL